MPSTGIKIGSVISVFVVLLAVLYKRNNDEILRDKLQAVLTGLLNAEKKAQSHTGTAREPRVAVGFGACLDVFADGVNVLDKIGVRPSNAAEHFSHINDINEVEKVFSYFFRHGAAAERYLQNSTLFEELVAVARETEGARLALGGNAPVMANRFYQEGCKVLLAATATKELREEIPAEIRVVGGELEEDDVHLLMEYTKGENWGKFTAPRANRFIIHNDYNNPHLKSMFEFVKEVKQFSPALVVVGGLQMMDYFPFLPGERKQLLQEMTSLLETIPRSTLMHFEMASFAEEACLKDIVENVVHHMDSLGMNEQELPNLYSLLNNGSVTLISDPYPRIATTLDHMRDVYRMIKKTRQTKGRPLTRLHVHTLAYQAILTTKDSPWKNNMAAAAKASLTANRHVCGSKYIHLDKARILMDGSFKTSREEGAKRIEFNNAHPISCWDEEDYEICIAPVLVCTDVVQTGGGGDNISSAGLVVQI